MSLPGAYRTADGSTLPAITTEEMRELDDIAIEETGPNLYQMMENAGRGLAEVVLAELERLPESGPIVVLAGTGGNGGGGICAARHLANRGLDVTVAVSRPDAMHEATAWQRSIFGSTSGAVVEVAYLRSLRARIIVDAVIGYSLLDAPNGAAGEMLQWAVEQRSTFGARVVSLDVPSGIDATSGDAPGKHVRADVTFALGLPKTGLHPSVGIDASVVGELKLGDLGLPSGLYARFGSPCPFRSAFSVELEPVGLDRPSS